MLTTGTLSFDNPLVKIKMLVVEKDDFLWALLVTYNSKNYFMTDGDIESAATKIINSFKILN